MSSKRIVPVNTPLFIGNEKKYLNDCIDTGWVSSDGSYVKEFEENFAKYVGTGYGISVCNGSLAIDLAIAALELKKGDEIILPTFTIISCISSIVRLGLKPVLVDCCPITFNMKSEDVIEKISSQTKAIMVVHIYGLPVDMDPIREIASEKNIKIIEDSAEMHGQTYKSEKCGSMGDISTFSFYANKHITTGEGGMVLTSDEELAEKCKYYRNLCFKPESRFVHDDLGWNFRMSNIQAAVGLAQLECIDDFILKKREIGKKYQQKLSKFSDIFQLPLKSNDFAENIYWVFSIVLKKEINFSLTEITKDLSNRGVGNRPFFWPMHLQPYLKKNGFFEGETYQNSEYIAKNGFYIPSGLGIHDDDIDYVCDAIESAVNKLS
ncbi:DegT/DnrJ/EryC1/StrS family aminotransferase [Gammaproteobacteria bacterium]|nr:DegT/DnrJ/EryC1/StrS family aminotransferase [Gammaproteobacteria bacterium]